tara:strand:+ start:303 stop:413 length:111 start_codon:yes stop_codon:yes gene_type:complete
MSALQALNASEGFALLIDALKGSAVMETAALKGSGI